MREWNMVISDIVEEVNFTPIQHKSSGDGVYRCITPSLVEETTILVKRFEKVDVSLGSKPV